MFDWGTFKSHPNWNQPETPKLELKCMVDFFVYILIFFCVDKHCFAEKQLLCWEALKNKPNRKCHEYHLSNHSMSPTPGMLNKNFKICFNCRLYNIMTWIHVGSNHATIEYYIIQYSIIVKWGLLSICLVRNLSGTVHPRALQDLQVSLCWKTRCWKASETELKNSFQPKGCVIVLKSTGAEKHPRRTGRQAGSFTWHPRASLFFIM